VRQDQFPHVARKGDEDSADADQELGADGHLVAAKLEGGNGKEVGSNQVAQTVRKEDCTKLPLLNTDKILILGMRQHFESSVLASG
jgi:hypothetical protein